MTSSINAREEIRINIPYFVWATTVAYELTLAGLESERLWSSSTPLMYSHGSSTSMS